MSSDDSTYHHDDSSCDDIPPDDSLSDDSSSDGSTSRYNCDLSVPGSDADSDDEDDDTPLHDNTNYSKAKEELEAFEHFKQQEKCLPNLRVDC